MDRRFFENDNVEDLSKNESPENFQKIDEEYEVLKENYMWSDEEDDFSSETDLNQSDEYPQSEEEDLDEGSEVNEYYDDLEYSTGSEKYITSNEDEIMEVNCQDEIMEVNCEDEEEYSDSDNGETSEEKLNCSDQYWDSDDVTKLDDICD